MLRHYGDDKHFIYGLDLSISTRCASDAAEEKTMAYKPPKQSLTGQVFDVFILLLLTVGALYIPLYLGLAGAAKTPQPIANPTWEALGQNATEQQQWAALGITDPAAASDIVTARFDYSFSWVALAVMAVLVIGYFVMVVRLSDREYREVIEERFGPKR